MKTKEELNALKEEVEALNKKLRELTEEELAQVEGGAGLENSALRAVAQHFGKSIGRKADKDSVFVSDDPNTEKEIHIYENTLEDFTPPTY